MLAATRTWDDALSDALVESHGELQGQTLARRYSGLFPDYYKSATPIRMAQFDVDQFESLGAERPYTVALQNEEGTAEPLTRLKLYKTGGKAPLSDLLPVLEALGLTVVEEVPTRLQELEGSGRYLHDFGVLGANGWPLDLDRVGELVADTVRAVWDGQGRERLAQPAGAGGGADLAPGGDAARVPPVPAAAGRRLHQALRERRLRAQLGARGAAWWRCSSTGSTPRVTAMPHPGRRVAVLCIRILLRSVHVLSSIYFISV